MSSGSERPVAKEIVPRLMVRVVTKIAGIGEVPARRYLLPLECSTDFRMLPLECDTASNLETPEETCRERPSQQGMEEVSIRVVELVVLAML